MNAKKVRKAVIAAAGFGTRFLPQTKAMPKEMLPLVDKPVIQYVVEELVEAGIEDIIIVTGYHKRSIEDHFDAMSADLEANLEAGNKKELLEKTAAISDLANFAYVRQKGPYGNATPIMNIRHLVGNEPFIYTYADDLILAKPNHFKQMIDAYQKTNACVLPCLEVTKDEDFDRYGIMKGKEAEGGLLEVETIVEKPGRAKAPSNLASVGGYLLSAEILDYLAEALPHHDESSGEFQVQPSMRQMIADGKKIYAMKIQNANYYDTGNKLEYLKTVIDFGLKDQQLGSDLKDYLNQKIKF